MAIHNTSHGGAIFTNETISGELDLTGEQTSTSTGTVNDFALTAGVSVLRWNGASACTLTGITGGASGRMLIVVNESSAQSLSFNNEAGGSTAANRLLTMSATSALVAAQGSAWFRYDGTNSRWRMIGLATSQFNSGVASNGTLTAAATLLLTGVTTTGSLSGTTNDWAPTSSFRYRVPASANATITGLATAVAPGRYCVIQNSSAFNITLTNEDSGSTAANRFTNPNSASLVLPPNASCYLIYDTITSRWITIPGAGCTVTQTVFAGATQTDTSTGTVNDFALSASATILRCNPASTATFNGIAGGVDGRLLLVINASGQIIDLVNEAGGSTAANRFTLQSAVTQRLNTACNALCIYDGTTSRWRIVAVCAAQTNGTFTMGQATVTGNLAVNGNTRLGDTSADLVGFYTTAGVAQASITALTDNSAGTANDTLEALTSGTVYSTDVAAIRNNFADLAAKINALRTILVNLGITT